MKYFALLSFSIVVIVILGGCDSYSRPRIPEIKDDLTTGIKLDSVSSGAGVGGTRRSDKIQSDQEDSLWVIPKDTDPNAVFEQLKDSVTSLLDDKGAEVVSSGSGASHGYIQEYLHQGGNVSSYTIIYTRDGGLGFVDIFLASYIAEEEAGRVGFNHIFIPYP
jgi:hypothetical protein